MLLWPVSFLRDWWESGPSSHLHLCGFFLSPSTPPLCLLVSDLRCSPPVSPSSRGLRHFPRGQVAHSSVPSLLPSSYDAHCSPAVPLLGLFPGLEVSSPPSTPPAHHARRPCAGPHSLLCHGPERAPGSLSVPMRQSWAPARLSDTLPLCGGSLGEMSRGLESWRIHRLSGRSHLPSPQPSS